MIIICPACGEDNPQEAVMCWACYATLDGKPLPKINRLPSEEFPSWLGIAGLFCAVGSGWLPQRFRSHVFGAGFLASCVSFALIWRERKNTKALTESREEPITLITNAILIQAAKDGATCVRLQIGVRGFQADYEINGAWHEQMKLPLYVWGDLRLHLRQLAKVQGDGTSEQIPVRLAGMDYRIAYSEDETAMYLDFAQD